MVLYEIIFALFSSEAQGASFSHDISTSSCLSFFFTAQNDTYVAVDSVSIAKLCQLSQLIDLPLLLFTEYVIVT